MPHEELVTKISTLRAHVQSLKENSESDEPVLPHAGAPVHKAARCGRQ